MNTQTTAIHPATHIGRVVLTARDLNLQAAFYERVIGLSVLERDGTHAVLGAAGGSPLLVLEGRSEAPRRPRFTTGLYHLAILLPSREMLGQALARLPRHDYPLGGYADHLVSEALYLTDPEGNGIELYRDRPRESWAWEGGTVKMANRHIDLPALLAEGERAGGQPERAPAGTTIGHVHLQVSSIAEAERFYHGVLGFDVVAQMPGALFVSAGGYHHHLGLNTWESSGAPRAPEGAAGLRLFDIVIPDAQGLHAAVQALGDAGVPVAEHAHGVTFSDPFGNTLLLSGAVPTA